MSQEVSKRMTAKRQEINQLIKNLRKHLKIKDLPVPEKISCENKIHSLEKDLRFYKPSVAPVRFEEVVVNGKLLKEIIKKLKNIEYALEVKESVLFIQYSDGNAKGQYVLDDLSEYYLDWPLEESELMILG